MTKRTSNIYGKSYDLLGFLAHASSFNNNYFERKRKKGVSYGHINVGDFPLFREKCGKLPSWIESTNSSFKNKSKRVELHTYPSPVKYSSFSNTSSKNYLCLIFKSHKGKSK